LKSAKVAGLEVDHTAFDGAIGYLDSIERNGQYRYSKNEARADELPSLSAMGCVCRQFLGFQMEGLQPSVDGLIAKGGLPAWGEKGRSVDLNYWYFATLCTFQQGGEVWQRWNEALKTALIVISTKLATTTEAGTRLERTRPNGDA